MCIHLEYPLSSNLLVSLRVITSVVEHKRRDSSRFVLRHLSAIVFAEYCNWGIFNTEIESSGCSMTARWNRALTADTTWSIEFSRRRGLILPLPVYDRIPTWNFPEFFEWSYNIYGTSFFFWEKMYKCHGRMWPMCHSAWFGYETNALSHILRFTYRRMLFYFILLLPFITMDIYAIFETNAIQIIDMFNSLHVDEFDTYVFLLYICIFILFIYLYCFIFI